MHLSESSSANSSDKLNMTQPDGHGGLSFEDIEELFTSQVGPMPQLTGSCVLHELFGVIQMKG